MIKILNSSSSDLFVSSSKYITKIRFQPGPRPVPRWTAATLSSRLVREIPPSPFLVPTSPLHPLPSLLDAFGISNSILIRRLASQAPTTQIPVYGSANVKVPHETTVVRVPRASYPKEVSAIATDRVSGSANFERPKRQTLGDHLVSGHLILRRLFLFVPYGFENEIGLVLFV